MHCLCLVMNCSYSAMIIRTVDCEVKRKVKKPARNCIAVGSVSCRIFRISEICRSDLAIFWISKDVSWLSLRPPVRWCTEVHGFLVWCNCVASGRCGRCQGQGHRGAHRVKLVSHQRIFLHFQSEAMHFQGQHFFSKSN